MCILYNLLMIMIHSSTYVSVLQMNGNGSNFVTIRMKPDAQGRFGFNVKVCRYLRVSAVLFMWCSFGLYRK